MDGAHLDTSELTVRQIGQVGEPRGAEAGHPTVGGWRLQFHSQCQYARATERGSTAAPAPWACSPTPPHSRLSLEPCSPGGTLCVLNPC
jgi:hypothetical protein